MCDMLHVCILSGAGKLITIKSLHRRLFRTRLSCSYPICEGCRPGWAMAMASRGRDHLLCCETTTKNIETRQLQASYSIHTYGSRGRIKNAFPLKQAISMVGHSISRPLVHKNLLSSYRRPSLPSPPRPPEAPEIKSKMGEMTPRPPKTTYATKTTNNEYDEISKK